MQILFAVLPTVILLIIQYNTVRQYSTVCVLRGSTISIQIKEKRKERREREEYIHDLLQKERKNRLRTYYIVMYNIKEIRKDQDKSMDRDGYGYSRRMDELLDSWTR